MSTTLSVKTASALKDDRNHGLGAVLRELRLGSRATQADIAGAMGVERTSVCNIENGMQALTIEKLVDFANHLNLDLTFSLVRRKRTGRPAVSVQHRIAPVAASAPNKD